MHRTASPALCLLALMGCGHPRPAVKPSRVPREQASRATQSPGQLVLGAARFTVITPTLIRLEYDPAARFVDAPSYFAIDRQQRDRAATWRRTEAGVIIDTGVLQLEYTPDGKPFSESNVCARLGHGAAAVSFSPAAPNTGNLGGATRTLDGWTGPGQLDDGILSRAGWYRLDDSRGPLLANDWVQARTSREQDWYLFGYGHDYKAALASLTALAGAVPLPRKYVLGAWYSRYWSYSAADFLRIADEYTEHGFPLDVMVLDMDWHLPGWTGWSWNPTLISNPAGLFAALHDRGLAVTLNLHPADGVAPHEAAYASFMRALGKDPATRETLPFDAGERAYMSALFKAVHEPLSRSGVDFFWLDWQQAKFTKSVPELENLPWLNELYFRYSARGELRGQSFSRWGGFGDHRHPIHFSGDAATSFEMLAFEVPFTAASSNSGLFFWSHDIGGHMGERNDEAYARWCQFGALSAALRSHSSRSADLDRRPWTYASWAQASMKQSFGLRSRLFPYLYSSSWQAAHDSLPLLRAMYIDYPEDEAAYRQPQQYALGDALLVAPITEPGAGPQRLGRQVVWFPEGTFYDAFTGERFQGPSEHLVASPLDELPLYVRAGVPLPLQPWTGHMGSAPIAQLIVRCYPGRAGERANFMLHEDDGQSRAYEHGEYASTELTCERVGDTVTVGVAATRGRYRGQLTERSYIIEVPATHKANTVRVDGAAAPFEYDAAALVNRVHVAARAIELRARVEVSATPVDDEELRLRAFARRTGLPARGPLPALVQTAWNRAASDDEKLAVLAAAGSGALAKNEDVYGYPGIRHFRKYEQPWAPVDMTVATHWLAGVHEVEDATLRYAGRSVVRRAPGVIDFDHGSSDLAVLAQPSFSSLELAETTGIADRRVGGSPEERRAEWSSNHEQAGAWVKLAWSTPQRIDRVVLYDRASTRDQITAAQLSFSDGSSAAVGELPNVPSQGPATVALGAREVTWLKLTVTAVSPSTLNAGLAELAVYGPDTVRY